jgi:hypothetical protein
MIRWMFILMTELLGTFKNFLEKSSQKVARSATNFMRSEDLKVSLGSGCNSGCDFMRSIYLKKQCVKNICLCAMR